MRGEDISIQQLKEYSFFFRKKLLALWVPVSSRVVIVVWDGVIVVILYCPRLCACNFPLILWCRSHWV